MNSPVYTQKGTKVGTIDLPAQFDEEIRPDLIKRAVITIQTNKRQPYGAYERAGKQQSTKLSRRRRQYKTAYGRGISRVPRKTVLRRGTQFIWVGARAPSTVGGARAHPPKGYRLWEQHINRKERLKAVRSAIAATKDKDLVKHHGYFFTETLPLVVHKDVEGIKQTKELKHLLLTIGLKDDLTRVSKRTTRAGRGKLRGRKTKSPLGPLVVVSSSCDLIKAVQNLAGFEVCTVESLNAELLAPGAVPGRLVIWTQPALERLSKEHLFLGKKINDTNKKKEKVAVS